MKSLLAATGELLGLFVDDSLFALEIIIAVAAATFVALEFPGLHWPAAVILVAGCIGSLIESTGRTTRPSAKRESNL